MQSNQRDNSEISRWLRQLFAPVYFDRKKEREREEIEILLLCTWNGEIYQNNRDFVKNYHSWKNKLFKTFANQILKIINLKIKIIF